MVKEPKNKPEQEPETVEEVVKEVAQEPAVETEVSQPAQENTEDKTISQLADEVMKGKYGSGRERMLLLGDKYAAVQIEVTRRIRSK